MKKVNNTGVLLGVFEYFAEKTKTKPEYLRLFVILALLAAVTLVYPKLVVVFLIGGAMYALLAAGITTFIETDRPGHRDSRPRAD